MRSSERNPSLARRPLHVPVTGTAYLACGLPWIAYPADLPLDAALAALDVCNAASQTRSLIGDETRTVLFFSMATSFTKAALGADGLASNARMLVGSGHASDNGAYALELLRRDRDLQRAIAEG